jgi:hypothetical protein
VTARPTTRPVRINRSRVSASSAYAQTFVGLDVVVDTSEGPLVGVVEGFRSPVSGAYGFPIVRFPDGRWTRVEYSLDVVAA